MSKVYYYVPNTYHYPYYTNVNTPISNQGNMTRSHQGNDQPVLEAILAGIKREASSIDLYHRLANESPNEKDQDDILQALETKNSHLIQFTNLYFSLTGRQPVYQIDEIDFDSYREGLQKAHEVGVEASEEYRNNALSSQHPQIQQIFLHASMGEKDNATRLEYLNGEDVKDFGGNPFVVDIEKVTTQNDTFRTALWTGTHFQLTLMSIDVGEDIGLEVHPHLDQFIRLEAGQGRVQMGDSQFNLDFEQTAYADYAIFIPAGKWHNLTNIGHEPIKLYSIYAPPEHPFGTVHETKAIAMAAEENHH